MSIDFDPKTKSYFDLLFGSAEAKKKLQEEHPRPELDIPDLHKDVPEILKSSKNMGEVMQRYQRLRENLLERHENFEKVLKGYLRPEEAIDIFDRLKEIDAALLETEQNLQRAMHLQSQLKQGERDERAAEPLDISNEQAERIWKQADAANEALDKMRNDPPDEVLDARVEAARQSALQRARRGV